MEFHERLRQLRINRGYTSKEVADKLGIAPSSYSQYESGKRQPDINKIWLLIKALNTTGDYLIGLSDSPEKKFVPKGDSLSPDTAQLIDNYNKLNSSGKEKASDYVEDLTTIDKYTAAVEIQSKLG